jgi:hypothetical protein
MFQCQQHCASTFMPKERCSCALILNVIEKGFAIQLGGKDGEEGFCSEADRRAAFLLKYCREQYKETSHLS